MTPWTACHARVRLDVRRRVRLGSCRSPSPSSSWELGLTRQACLLSPPVVVGRCGDCIPVFHSLAERATRSAAGREMRVPLLDYRALPSFYNLPVASAAGSTSRACVVR